MVWARMQSQWKGKNYCLSFLEEVGKSYALFYNVFLGRDFLAFWGERTVLHSTIYDSMETVARFDASLVASVPEKVFTMAR